MGRYTRNYDFQAGQTIVADQVDAEFNTIAGILNGNVDADNVKDGSLTSDKLQDGTLLMKDMDVNLQQGWTAPAAAWAYGAADAPSFTITETGDITSKIYPGVRVKLQQTQAISNYWSFDTNSADSKGAAVMGNIGTPTYTSGKFGNALTLNGSNQALSITDTAAFHLGASGAEFTIGGWIKTGNTGANKIIYQALSINTNFAGIRLIVNANNVIEFNFGNNTAVNGGGIYGTTTVTDNVSHYVVATFRNNYLQVYVDGKLDASGYMATPVYAGTTYTRIGVGSSTGDTYGWFNGQIDDLFLINGYALDEQTIAAKYAAGNAQGTADLTLTKYFLCTASSYSAPNTTVTLYGGTDHSLANATISNAYYSSQKAPYGFPNKREKWSITVTDDSNQSQASPSTSLWYNPGTLKVDVPIGSWNLYYKAAAFAQYGSAQVAVSASLSKLNNAETDLDMRSGGYVTATAEVFPVTANKDYSFSTKTPHYLIIRTLTSGASSISFQGNSDARTVIRATSTLL